MLIQNFTSYIIKTNWRNIVNLSFGGVVGIALERDDLLVPIRNHGDVADEIRPGSCG